MQSLIFRKTTVNKYLIKQASIVNEGEIKIADVLIVDELNKSIANSISANNVNIIDAEGLYLLPGMINRLETIAIDHAPHLLSEKEGIYFQVKAGSPLVQHALPIMLELYHKGKISLQKIIEKTSHHVAEIYRIKEISYIRADYFADLVLVDINKLWQVNKQSLLYKCNRSPHTQQVFQSTITHTFFKGNFSIYQWKHSKRYKRQKIKI